MTLHMDASAPSPSSLTCASSSFPPLSHSLSFCASIILTVACHLLHFPCLPSPEAETPIETKLELKNTSDRYLVFKIKTTRPKQYVVKPNSGVVQPRSASSIKSESNAKKEE